MGQYYKVVNVDKKEFLSPWAYDSGAKLMEFSYIDENFESNKFIGALQNLMQNEWKNDRVYIVGDYADTNYANYVEKPETKEEIKMREEFEKLIGKPYPRTEYNKNAQETLKELEKEITWINQIMPGYEFEEDPARFSLYSCDQNGYKELENVKPKALKRFIVNTKIKEYIDLTHLPKEYDYDECNVFINPLPLLIAIGNGQGGGDYKANNHGQVGEWAKTVKYLDFTDEKPENYCEYIPEFTENTID